MKRGSAEVDAVRVDIVGSSRSSAAVGGSTVATVSATSSSQPVAARTCSTVTPGCTATSRSSSPTPSRARTPSSVTTRVTPAPSGRMPSASARSGPGVVQKSRAAGKERGVWRRITTKTSRALAITSTAPPEPGSRTAGRSHSPITEVLRLPHRSICAAPRKPTSIRPPWSTEPKSAGIDSTASAPVISTASAMVSGRWEGCAPQTPDSYTTSISGATVSRASSAASVGSPIPANTARRPVSSRAATTESSSETVALPADFVRSWLTAASRSSPARSAPRPPRATPRTPRPASPRTPRGRRSRTPTPPATPAAAPGPC